jgi:hypothetical protein
MWFPSEAFNQRAGHLISSVGIPLSIIPMSAHALCRYHVVKLGNSQEGIQILNKASLYVIVVGIISMVGVAAVNFSLSPAIHYTFAGVFFLSFAIDTALQLLMTKRMDANTYRSLRGDGSKVPRYIIGSGVLAAALASLGGTAAQSFATMSVGELTFIVFVFLFWSQDYALLARCEVSFILTQRHALEASESCGVCPF